VQTRPFSTIYLRLFVPFAFALLLGTVIAWWIGSTVLYHTLEDRVLQQLNNVVEVVSERSFPVTDVVLTRLNKLLGASIYVFDNEGKLVVRGDKGPRTELMDELDRQYSIWQARNTTKETINFTAAKRNYLLILYKSDPDLQSRHQAVAALMDLSDVNRATHRGGLWLAGLAACGIAILAFIGHWVARSITVPIGELATMAGSIAAGDRAMRVNVRRQDEVGILAQSLNSMAERLAMYDQQVAEQSRLLTLGELSAKVAHEIRNPLTAIKMQLQLLEDDLPATPKSRLHSLIDEVRRLELIVSSTLQLGRPEKLERQLLNLNSLVTDVVYLLKPQFEHQRIMIATELAANLPDCWLDANRVKQIMLNLMNNAADELPEGGQLVVRTVPAENRDIVLEVADSGPGIPGWQRSTLFDRVTSGKPSGFGLGLRVTRELVELHGGTIEVAESGLGGALFRVVFPAES
jgi:signal transduction histidine kinase